VRVLFTIKAMRRPAAFAHDSIVILLLLSLVATNFLPASASSSNPLVTCTNLISGKERISKNGTCRVKHEARANWHLAPSDTSIKNDDLTKGMIICSNSENSTFTYRIIRKNCARHMQKDFYTRSSRLPAIPVIKQASSSSHDGATLTLETDPAEQLDAPVAYYTITSDKGDTQKIYSWGELSLSIGGLTSSTRYSFTVTATNVDGTSAVSAETLPVTTRVYVPPAPVTTAPALTCSTGGVCMVGETGPGGGIIFYVSASNFTSTGSSCNTECRYLEVAPTTGPSSWTDSQYNWSSDDSSSHFTDGSATSIGTGMSNTFAMLTTTGSYNQDTSQAAFVSAQYRGPNSKNDWFLPSKDELNQLCKWQRGQAWVSDATLCDTSGSINNPANGAGTAGFVSGNYWSSSEAHPFPWAYTGWNQEFHSGGQYNYGKNFGLYVRPIRAF